MFRKNILIQIVTGPASGKEFEKDEGDDYLINIENSNKENISSNYANAKARL